MEARAFSHSITQLLLWHNDASFGDYNVYERYFDKVQWKETDRAGSSFSSFIRLYSFGVWKFYSYSCKLMEFFFSESSKKK